MKKPRVVCLSFKDSPDVPLTEVAEACLRFTPQIAVREGSAIFLEIGGCANLYSEESLLKRLTLLCQRFGIFPKLGLAADAPTALAIARYQIRKRERLPVEALIEYATPFSRDELAAKRIGRMIDSLKLLGLTSVGDFLDLPVESLASRFGEGGLELHLQVRGEIPLVWPAFKPVEKIVEGQELFDPEGASPCYGLEPLLFVLKALTDRAMARLRGRGLRASVLQIDLALEALSTRSWRIELPVPQGGTTGVLAILRDKLGYEFMRNPLAGSVTELRLTVLETAPGHGSQKNLFNRDELESEAWDALVGRLRQRLGGNRAFAAHPVDRHLPENAWGPAAELRNISAATSGTSFGDLILIDTPSRPARVLKNPETLQREGEKLISTERKSEWRVARWIGPERISCEWWQDTAFKGFNRDYYHVITESGEQLWVYAVPGRHELFLHGYFD